MSLVVDLLAACSVVGIWPRFIEPRTLKVTHLKWELQKEAEHLEGVKIVHLTDLHFHAKIPQSFLDRIACKIAKLKPDLVLFTGDFICYSRLEEKERLAAFLQQLEGKLGSFCTLGNHDYSGYVTLTREGVYDILPPPNPLTGVFRGIKTLLSPPINQLGVSEKVRKLSLHRELCALLQESPFQLLENTTHTLPLGLNITGLGDIALGRCDPKTAFANYNNAFPGLVLSHNPDTLPHLLPYPGDWILAGHTHGEQIHIPWPKWGRSLSQKLARLQNQVYTRGLFKLSEQKRLYVNRGLGCHKPFRLFSPPEICFIHAEVAR